MFDKWKAYNDAHSRALFLRFKEALEPLMAQVAPDWVLHHIELRRDSMEYSFRQQVEIRLVIRPIGEANFVDADADLATGPRRLTKG